MEQSNISSPSTGSPPQDAASLPKPRREQEADNPFPLIIESHTPLIDISSSCPSSSDSDSKSPTTIGNSVTTATSTSRARAKKARKAAHAHATQPTVPSLRPAKDILSRIRHDPDLGGESAYVVGYVDRHERHPLEMDVAEWCKGGVGDVTDEEFIPQHRILYFRRKGDGEGRKVWDRARRLDRIFGSGIVEREEVDGDEGEGLEGRPGDGEPEGMKEKQVTSEEPVEPGGSI